MVGRILVQSLSLREAGERLRDAEQENRAPVRGETLLKHLDAEWESNLRIKVSYTSVETSRKFWVCWYCDFLGDIDIFRVCVSQVGVVFSH